MSGSKNFACYRVVSYRSPTTAERINIGIVATPIDSGGVSVISYLKKWSRFNAFVNKPAMDSYCIQFMKMLEGKTKPEIAQIEYDERKNPYSWFEFTESRASILPIDELIKHVSGYFLVD